MKTIEVTIGFRPRTFANAAVLVLALAALPRQLGSETVTLVSSYPSSVGIYGSLITTNQTVVGSSGVAPLPNVLLVPNGGSVGIRTTTPGATLGVAGDVHFTGDVISPTVGVPGQSKIVTSLVCDQIGTICSHSGTRTNTWSVYSRFGGSYEYRNPYSTGCSGSGTAWRGNPFAGGGQGCPSGFAPHLVYSTHQSIVYTYCLVMCIP